MTDAQLTVMIVAIAVVVLVGGLLLLAQRRRRSSLRERFGPEYDRTVQRSDGRRSAERDLGERAERREQLDIRPLPVQAREAFAARWQATQEDFVDGPARAVQAADDLVEEVMRRRGYPVGDVDQQIRDVSVDHGDVVEQYRAAHDIAQLNARQQATTEQLRQAMVHYRALFTELLDDGVEPYGAYDRPDDQRTRRSSPRQG